MNSAAHRLIFNLHRGQFMPVAEIARSHGKGRRAGRNVANVGGNINNIENLQAIGGSVVPVSSVNLNEFQGEGSGTRYPASSVYQQNVRDSFYRWVIGGVAYDRSYQYVYNRTTTETQVQSSDPAQILAGGAMNLSANSLLNDKSRIIAGGTLSGNLGSLNNTEVAGERVSTDSGTAYHYIDHQPSGCCNDWTEIQATGYNPAPSVESISLTPTVYQQNTAPAGSGTQISALSSGNVSQAPSGANAASVTINNGPAISPITQVAALNGNNAGGPATVVRSGGVNTGVPNNSLFSLTPNPNAGYRFTGKCYDNEIGRASPACAGRVLEPLR